MPRSREASLSRSVETPSRAPSMQRAVVKAAVAGLREALRAPGLQLKCMNHSKMLFRATKAGNLGALEHHLGNDNRLVNLSKTYHDTRLLHVAAQHGQHETLQWLLDHDAKVDVCNSFQQTPLMLACKLGFEACVASLLEKGATVLMFDFANGRTCLHYAAAGGFHGCLEKVLEGARLAALTATWGFRRFINLKDRRGTTALHLAARSGDLATVRCLLENGALVSTSASAIGNRPGHGSLPLHFAARGGSAAVVRELIAWGADRTSRDLHGFTPHHIALRSGHVECAALLDLRLAEPLVWPSPWLFMSRLDAQVRSLLEAAIASANEARSLKVKQEEEEKRRQESAARLEAGEVRGASSARQSGGLLPRGFRLKLAHAAVSSSSSRHHRVGKVHSADHVEDEKEEAQKEEDMEVLKEMVDDEFGGLEECSICFERPCQIEVKECDHRMCATCTLALCCHCKPNHAAPSAPPPLCPFCRQVIKHLIAI